METMTEPQFNVDWFTENIPEMEKYLGHLKGRRYARGLEIGSWEGRSALWFLSNILTGEGANIVCIDDFSGNPENHLQGYEAKVPLIFEENIRRAGEQTRVNLIRQKSNTALLYLHPRSFDFIYVDGSHNPKDVIVDLVHSWRLLKHGGVMVMDDYELCEPVTGSRPKTAIDAFHAVFKSDIIELHKGWQAIWRKI